MQNRDKSGILNPQFGIKKSTETLAKLTKLVYVYDYFTKNLIKICYFFKNKAIYCFL